MPENTPAGKLLAVIWRLVGDRDCGYIKDMVPPPSDGLGLARVSIPELHDAPVFYPAGTRLIWISTQARSRSSTGPPPRRGWPARYR